MTVPAPLPRVRVVVAEVPTDAINGVAADAGSYQRSGLGAGCSSRDHSGRASDGGE
jgi:hypothetical protein